MLIEIKRYLEKHPGLSPTQFGRLAANNSTFMTQFKRGDASDKMLGRVRAFLDAEKAAEQAQQDAE